MHPLYLAHGEALDLQHVYSKTSMQRQPVTPAGARGDDGARVPCRDESQDQPAVNCPCKLRLSLQAGLRFIGCERWEDGGGRRWRRVCRN